MSNSGTPSPSGPAEVDRSARTQGILSWPRILFGFARNIIRLTSWVKSFGNRYIHGQLWEQENVSAPPSSTDAAEPRAKDSDESAEAGFNGGVHSDPAVADVSPLESPSHVQHATFSHEVLTLEIKRYV